MGGVQTGGRGWAAARAMPGRGRESAGGEHAKSGGQAGHLDGGEEREGGIFNYLNIFGRQYLCQLAG